MYNLYALYNDNWVNILPKSDNITWSDDEDTLCVNLSFDSIYDLTEGTHVALKNDSTDVFSGMIVKKTTKKFTNSYTCFDYGMYLNRNETIIQFNSISTDQAIEQLCSQFGIECDIVEIDSTLFNRTKMVTLKKASFCTAKIGSIFNPSKSVITNV